MSTDDPYEVARKFLEQVSGLIAEQETHDMWRRAVEHRNRLIAEGEARHEEWLRETGIGAWFDTP